MSRVYERWNLVRSVRTVKKDISVKLDYEIRMLKEDIQKELRKRNTRKQKVSQQVVSDIIADLIRRWRYGGRIGKS